MKKKIIDHSEDHFKDGCGVFGIIGHPEAAKMTYLGLHALQHRGQESAGIVSSYDKKLHAEFAMGLVADIFTQNRLNKLPGNMAIGHNRYSTTGESLLKNVQPLVVDYCQGSLAIAHNGNLVNAHTIRNELEAYGAIFSSTMDTEVIVHLIAQSRQKNFTSRIIDALNKVKGAYSLVLINEDQLVAVRDPSGFRPLLLGKLNDSFVVASESCSFDLIDAELIREIEPGEMILIKGGILYSFKPFAKTKMSSCVFEFIYFARPDSYIFGDNVNKIRRDLGIQLARESSIDADIVIPVPDSGIHAALGFSQESGIPFELGLTRSHYMGRTFIEPEQSIRHFGVKLKLNPLKNALNGKKVIVVDDSIVRGTTSRKIVKMIRAAGATKVHLRISSPATKYPCYYGIDTPVRSELIAATHTLEEACKYITADTLSYLSMEGLMNIFKERKNDFCYACFDGNYPIEFMDIENRQMKLF